LNRGEKSGLDLQPDARPGAGRRAGPFYFAASRTISILKRYFNCIELSCFGYPGGSLGDISFGERKMSKGETIRGPDRRNQSDRRSGDDTRSAEEKRLGGERRRGDRRLGSERRADIDRDVSTEAK
jgi:hypothetical protein